MLYKFPIFGEERSILDDIFLKNFTCTNYSVRSNYKLILDLVKSFLAFATSMALYKEILLGNT